MAQKELSDLVLIPYSSMRGNARRRARSSLIEDLRNPDPESEFGQMILPYLPLLRMPLVGTPLSKAGLLWMEHFMNYDALFLVSPKAGYQDREYGMLFFACTRSRPGTVCIFLVCICSTFWSQGNIKGTGSGRASAKECSWKQDGAIFSVPAWGRTKRLKKAKK